MSNRNYAAIAKYITIGFDIFEVDEFDVDEYEIEEFSFDEFELDKYEGDFIKILRRGVIGVHQIGYV